jgi:hypothetical protein
VEDSLNTAFEQLQDKLFRLLEEYRVANEELRIIKEENVQLHKIIHNQNEQLKSFQNQEKITKIVSSVAEEEGKNKELKLKINEYIKEIDRCIAHLSK